MPGPDSYEDEAVGVYGDDPLGIMSGEPDPAAYYRYDPPERRECTCPRPRRRALLVKHGSGKIPDDHECAPGRPGIDWAEVFAGLAVWRRA